MASVNDGWCVFGKVAGVTTLVILLLTGGAGALSNSGGGSWQYYKEITISNSGSINDSSWTNTATLYLGGVMVNGVIALAQGADGTIYATAYTEYTNGSVYRTTDGGASWFKTVLPYSWVGSLVIMPNGHIFVGTANAPSWTDADLYKSIDGGITWTRTPEPVGNFSGYPAPSIVLLAMLDGTLYVGYKTHLYRTVNEGDSWEDVYAFPYEIASLLGGADGTLYVGTGGWPYAGYVYRGNVSASGITWTKTGDLKDSEGNLAAWVQALAEGKDGALYAGTEIIPYKGTLFRSGDHGNTWQQVTGIPRGINSNAVRTIAVTSDGTLYAGLHETSGNLYRGRNVGTPQENWTRVWGPADYGVFSLLAATDGRLYFGTYTSSGQARILKSSLDMPSNLTNYQVLVNLTSSNFPTNAQTSGADIRFTDASGNELSYWIENWDYAGKSAKIWVNVTSKPASGSTTIRMYYGNPSATGSSNGTATFQFFDDFNDGIINPSLWPTNVGDTSPCWYSPSCGTTDHIGATESGGVMSISHSYSNNYKLIKSNAIFNIPFRFGMKIKDSGGINDVYKSAGVGQPTSATYDNGGNNRVNLRRQWNGNFYDTMRDGSIEQNNLSTTMVANTWYTYLFSASPSQVDFYNETSRQIQTTHIPNISTPLSVYVKTWTGDNSGSATISVDYIFLANYSYPEPSISVGAEKATMPTPTNTIPIASFIYTKVGLTASFTSTSYDVDGTITEHNWDFGDGTFSKMQNPVHTYSINGNYQILLTVTDNNGSKSSKTETISISSVVISSVNHPLDISFGTGLLVKVKTNIETDITLNLDSIHQINKYGTDVAFYVNPAMLTKGSHTLKISAGGDSYNSSIIVYDPKIYLAITKGLDDLATTSKDEMREISGKTGYTLTNHVYSILLETEVGEDVTAGDVLNDLRNKLGEISEHVTQELEKYKNIVISIDSTIKVNELDSAIILITNIQNAIDESNELISDENIIGSINEYVTKPAIYTVLSSNEANSIEARTYVTKNNLNPSYTQAQLDEINEILSIGKEAIINTDEEQIYSLDIGTFFGREISAKPTLDYFAERQTESLNPPEDMCVFSKCFPGKYNPIWVYHLTVADAESILTIPAFIGWISATPEDERINARVMPIVAPVVMAVRAIKVYMKYASFVESISPWVIDGGMIVSTNLLAQEVNEEHADIIQTISGITTGMGLSESINSPKLIGSNLYVPKGNILITTSPDGEIRSFKYVKSDSVSSVPKNRRVISINTGWSQTFNSLLKNISIAIATDKSSYNVSEMVNLTINISSDAYVEDALLWIFIPEANTTIKDMLNVTIGNMSKNYNFTIQNETWHIPRVYLSNFGTILAENYTNFGVGSESREAGTITINYKEFYNPGTVNINLTVHNTGNTPLDSRLIHSGSNQNLTGSIGIPTLQIRESTTVQLAFNLTIPEVYEMRFTLNSSNNSKGMLDYNVVRFTVTAIDTLLAFPSTAKTIYNASESVNINVSIKNVTLNILNFPYSLNTIAPSGDIINLKSFTPEHNGTYIVKATPITEGYSVVEGETLFIVEEQSSLVIETNTSGNTTKIIVKTDLGGAVEGANVVVNGYALKTDKNGAVLFNSFNATQLIIKAEKFGFNPIAISVAILAAPKTIYVSKNFTDDPVNHRWNSIQEGIDDAASVGDMILVYSGMYYENVNVSKRLILKGVDTGGGAPIVNASGNGSAINITVNGIILEGFDARNGYAGIYVISNGNIIRNNNISNNFAGIYLVFSRNNTLIGNNASNNGEGIFLNYSSDNTLITNTVNSNHEIGIVLYSSSKNTLNNNNASRSAAGIYLINSSNNNTLINNTANSNKYLGINIDYSSSNRIYHNNLINNTYWYQAYDRNGTNFWHSGYPSGGNYWSDYQGTDANNDGIGDTPYNISGGAGAQDRYPFMKLNGWLSASALKGDVNDDNQVTVVDALFVAQYTVGLRTLTSQQLAVADVNGDGQVNVVDALFIAQYTVGLRQL